MLRQSECVLVYFFAELTDVIADFGLDFCQLGFGLLGHLNNVEFGIDVA